MREILFRGKHLIYDTWVEGYLVIKTNPIFENMKLYFIFNQERSMDGILDLSATCTTIKPATVGQFTGLKDVNGKKIFEGDIVRAKNEFGDSKGYEWTIMPVTFEFCGFALNLGRYASTVTFEVIGNIHDNPELLEVQHE